jgi:thiamine biosynthesis lipoprotein
LRIPTQDEIDRCLKIVGVDHVDFDEINQTIQFDRDGVELNLGGIGKGYALDRAGEELSSREVDEWLLHGGHSSLLARGDHNGSGGWPVGIGNPLFTGKRLGTIVLRDRAMATSGSNIQYFRHQGKKYGHILNPRNGWPIETMLSATVLAPTAAMADALSTAFYVMGVEKVTECCDNLDGVGAILIPFPSGRQIKPVVLGIPEDKLFLDVEQIAD